MASQSWTPPSRHFLLTNKYSCFVVQLLMVYLPPDQREKLAHILLDIEDAERSEKLLRDLVVDVNGSRSAESLIRACSAATANSLFDHVILAAHRGAQQE